MSSLASATIRSTGSMSCCPGTWQDRRRKASPPEPALVKAKQPQPAADAYLQQGQGPQPFDLVLWVAGHGAMPFLRDGPMLPGTIWQRWNAAFGGNFLGYAFFIN